ncbi:Dynamin family protein, partial [Reticulomyxa filosa]
MKNSLANSQFNKDVIKFDIVQIYFFLLQQKLFFVVLQNDKNETRYSIGGGFKNFGYTPRLNFGLNCYKAHRLFCTQSQREEFREYVDKCSNLIREFLSAQRSVLDEYNQHVAEDVEKFERDLHTPYKFAFVGGWNKGKSSLINQLMGTRVAKVDDVPTTAIPTLYVVGKTSEVVQKTDKAAKEELQLMVLPNAVSICGIENIVIVDLPGLNAHSSHGHDAVVKDFLKRVDQIAYVTDVHQVLSQSDEATFEHIQSIGRTANLVILINKCDHIEDSNRLAKIKQYIEKELSPKLVERPNADKADTSRWPTEQPVVFLVSAKKPGHYEWDEWMKNVQKSMGEWQSRERLKIQHILENVSRNCIQRDILSEHIRPAMQQQTQMLHALQDCQQKMDRWAHVLQLIISKWDAALSNLNANVKQIVDQWHWYELIFGKKIDWRLRKIESIDVEHEITAKLVTLFSEK